MAGHGPAPKEPGKRVRQHVDPIEATFIREDVAPQPPLPDNLPWPERTREWWNLWGQSPQAEHFTSTDWDFMLDTAVIHSAFWSGDMKVAPELRLRMAKFGATPEDRARLRMRATEDPGPKQSAPASSSRERYGELRVTPIQKAS